MIKLAMAAMTGVLLSLNAYSHGGVAGVTSAKAIELAAHRIDRLVALNKIDGSFLKKLDKIEVEIAQNQAPVYYRVRVSQTVPAQGNPVQLDIAFDDDGKPLSFQLLPNGVSGPDIGWTEKSAGELTENALHYVLENAKDPKVGLFDKAATAFTLTKGVLKGQPVARGQVTSSATTEKLNIYLKLDGTFISAEIVQ